MKSAASTLVLVLGAALYAVPTPLAGQSGTPAGAPALTRAETALLVGKTVPAHVLSVADGDTIRVRFDNGKTVSVRLEGIDTPEAGESFSNQARTATRVLMLDKRVQIRATDLDRYDRLVGRVTVGGVDTSIALLNDGLACHFLRYSSDQALAAAQQQARAGGRGFWALSAQKPACVAQNAPARSSGAASPRGGTATAPRPPSSTTIQPLLAAPSAAPTNTAASFHGNTRSRVYHAPSCPNYSCPNCTVILTTEADALSRGFKPAGDCLPASGR